MRKLLIAAVLTLGLAGAVLAEFFEAWTPGFRQQADGGYVLWCPPTGGTPFWWTDPTYKATVLTWIMTNTTALVPDESYFGTVISPPGHTGGVVSAVFVGATNGLAAVRNYDGNEDYINVNGAKTTLASSASGYVSMWYKLTALPSASGYMMFGAGKLADTTNSIGISIHDDGIVALRVINRLGTTDRVRIGRAATAGVWHHAVVQSSGSAYSFVSDGFAEAPTVVAGANNGEWFNKITGLNAIGTGGEPYSGSRAFDWAGQIWRTSVGTNQPTAAQWHTNYLFQAAQLGIVNGFWTTTVERAAMYMTSAVLEVTFNNVAQDGTTNATAIAASDVATAVSVTAPGVYPPNGKGAFDFNGTADYYSFGTITRAGLNTDKTIFFWIYPDSTGTAVRVFQRHRNSGAVFYGAGWETSTGTNAGLLTAFVNDGTEMLGSFGAVKVGQWTLCAMAYDQGAATVTCYTNGVVASGRKSASWGDNAADTLFIGARDNTQQWFDGKIGWFTIIHRKLTAAENLSIYTATKGAYGL